jgi:hypothetical protein
MKNILLLVPVVFLTGCLFKQPVPVQQVWPDVPKELLEACPDLKNVDPNTSKLSDILDVVTENYSQYYGCKSKVDDWIMWYNENKKIYEK